MDYGIKSDIGLVRLENQDRVSVFNKDNFTFLILCDGMGGHFGGALASSTTITAFEKYFNKNLPEEGASTEAYAKWFKSAVDYARNKMIDLAGNDEAKLDMGTTVTGALVNKKLKTLLVFNIGDSRTYVLRTDGILKQVSIDHNLYNKLVNEDHLSHYEAMKNKWHAALTSALGPNKKTKIEVFDISDSYPKIYSIITTSDGVHNYLEIPEFEQIAGRNKKASELCQELVTTALENKSSDNASAGMIVLDNEPEWRR